MTVACSQESFFEHVSQQKIQTLKKGREDRNPLTVSGDEDDSVDEDMAVNRSDSISGDFIKPESVASVIFFLKPPTAKLRTMQSLVSWEDAHRTVGWKEHDGQGRRPKLWLQLRTRRWEISPVIRTTAIFILVLGSGYCPSDLAF